MAFGIYTMLLHIGNQKPYNSNSKALLQHAVFRIAVQERELRFLLHPNLKNERLRPGSVPAHTGCFTLNNQISTRGM